MKFFLVALLLCTVESVRVASRRDASKDRTITQVVKLLQGMLEASRADADKEADLYGIYKCYVDTQTREKTANIRKLGKQIALLTSEIEELMSSNGQLSVEVAKLKQDMADNELARDQADKLRKDEKEAFDKLDADLTAAIQQLKDAIDALGEIGADQNLADGEVSADHEQFMAGYEPESLLKVKAEVKKALLLSKAFVTNNQREKYGSFLQAPFTGAYMSQSGEVVGILKQMLETFEANLEAAKEAEEKAIETHAEFIKTKKDEHDTMDQSSQDKQAELSANDLELTDKKGLHTTAVTQKKDDEEFLEKLAPLAEQKAKEWQARQMWRANEDAAISEAIALLDSDKSFKAFGAVEATKTGATGFLQVASSEHRSLRGSAKEFLQQAAKSMHSKRLAGVAALLSKGNPFTVVIEAIEGVKKNINEEAKVDKKHKDWCEEERKENNKNLDDKKDQIVSLTAAVDTLDDTINHPSTGLKVTIEGTETDLEENMKSQEDETKTRKEENEEYQREAEECEDAEAILKQAIEILNKYYDDMAASYEKEIAGSFVQKREDPAPPSTWDAADGYAGQSDQGNKVIEMLEFVVKETQKEATALHDAELSAQHAYEDSMKDLTDEEEKLQSDLVKLKKDLADAEEELEAKTEQLKQTEKEKKAIEDYLESIKPGCDFITDNFADRETARGKELAALDTAIDKLKGTAGYTKATTEEKHADWEEQGCKEICLEGEDHANCKACLSEVSVPGYCAGHPGTTGC